MPEALIIEKCLSSTYCMHEALLAGSRGRACLLGVHCVWPAPLSSNCQATSLVGVWKWQLQMVQAS